MSKSDKKMGLEKPKYREEGPSPRKGARPKRKGSRDWIIRIVGRESTPEERAELKRVEAGFPGLSARYASLFFRKPWEERVVDRYHTEKAARRGLEILRRKSKSETGFSTYTAEELDRAVVEYRKRGSK